MIKKPIILDCDPGVDDAYAIMLAHSWAGFDIRAITPVAGNVEYQHTTATPWIWQTCWGSPPGWPKGRTVP